VNKTKRKENKTMASPLKIVSKDKRKADRSNQPQEKKPRALVLDDDEPAHQHEHRMQEDDEEYEQPLLVEHDSAPVQIPDVSAIDDAT
jgi:hypothetical protein